MGQRPLDVRGQGFRVEVTLVPLLGHRGGTHRIEFPRERAIDVTRSRRGGFADALEQVVQRWRVQDWRARGLRRMTPRPTYIVSCLAFVFRCKLQLVFAFWTAVSHQWIFPPVKFDCVVFFDQLTTITAIWASSWNQFLPDHDVDDDREHHPHG